MTSKAKRMRINGRRVLLTAGGVTGFSMMTFLGMASAHAAETPPVTTTDTTPAAATESPDISKVESTATNAIEQYENGNVSSIPGSTELGPVQIIPKETTSSTSTSDAVAVDASADTSASDAVTPTDTTESEPVKNDLQTNPSETDVADDNTPVRDALSPVASTVGDSAGNETAVMDRTTDYTAIDPSADLATPDETADTVTDAEDAPAQDVTDDQKPVEQNTTDTQTDTTKPTASPSNGMDTTKDTDTQPESTDSKFKLSNDKVTSGSDVSGFLDQKLPEGSTVWVVDKNGDSRPATVSSDGRSFTFNGTLDPGDYTVEVRDQDGKSTTSSKLNVTEKPDEDLFFNPRIETPILSESGDVINVKGSGYNGYKSVKITYFDPATNRTTERTVAVDEDGNFVDDKYGLAYSPEDRVVVIVTAVDKDGKVTTESKDMNVSAPGRPSVDLNVFTKPGGYYQVSGDKFVPNETYTITVHFSDGTSRNYTVTPDDSKSVRGDLDTSGWPSGLATISWSNASGYRVPLDQLVTVISEDSPIDPGDPDNPPVNPVDPDPDPDNPPTPIPDPDNPDPDDPVIPGPDNPGNPGDPDPDPNPSDPDPGTPNPDPGENNPGKPGDGDGSTPQPGNNDGPIQVDPVVNIDPDRGDGNGNNNGDGAPRTDAVSDQSSQQEERSGDLLSGIIDALTNRKEDREVNDTARLEPDATATPDVNRLNALAGRDDETTSTPLATSQREGEILAAGPNDVDRLNNSHDSKQLGRAHGDKKMDSFTYNGDEDKQDDKGEPQASEASDASNNEMQTAITLLGGIVGLTALCGAIWWFLAARRRNDDDEQGRHVA